MTTVSAVGDRYDLPDRNPARWHPLVRARWPALRERLAADGFGMFVNEGYRPELRQQWLWAQGRTAAECGTKGINPRFARPGPIVTNAWSARLSAHGVIMLDPATGNTVIPASAALDVVPVGDDGKPWSHDDPWDAWLAKLAEYGSGIGLVHFTSRGKISDMPHLQLIEWSDREHRLMT
jgi:hypothetical protein